MRLSRILTEMTVQGNRVTCDYDQCSMDIAQPGPPRAQGLSSDPPARLYAQENEWTAVGEEDFCPGHSK